MNLGVDQVKAAVLAIDMHRGHLDLSVATMPVRNQEQSDRIVASAAAFYAWARASGIPIVHLVTTYRDASGYPYRIDSRLATDIARLRQLRPRGASAQARARH